LGNGLPGVNCLNKRARCDDCEEEKRWEFHRIRRDFPANGLASEIDGHA
jgi:hypothetical protein